MDARFPEPELPVRPVLSFSGLSGRRRTSSSSIEDAGRVVWLTSGRVAIALGLEYHGISGGDEVLLPAYNCSTMVDAIEAVGAVPVFYRCDVDLSPDMADVEGKISERTKAMLAVHFFGFPQQIERFVELSRSHGLVLIEDCAHAYFGEYAGRPLGAFGDFSIASAMKFFPVSDGGCLVFPDGSVPERQLRSGGLGFEIKSIVNNVERAVRYGRFSLLKWPLSLLIACKDRAWSAIKKRSADVDHAKNDGHESLGPNSSYGGFGFDHHWVNVRISWFSRLLIRYLPRARNVEKRRSHYLKLLASLSGFANAKPLFNKLSDGVVPYVFPLVVTPVDEVFRELKTAGVPILRWEDIDQSVCDVSSRYSRELLQFPCHQDVSDEELTWMIERIRSALRPAT